MSPQDFVDLYEECQTAKRALREAMTALYGDLSNTRIPTDALAAARAYIADWDAAGADDKRDGKDWVIYTQAKDWTKETDEYFK